MSDRWIFDASPLIVLAKAGLIQIIPQICQTPIIPPGVALEINRGPSSDPARLWMAIIGHVYVSQPVPIDPRVASWDLGQGELEVLSLGLANASDADLILDDLAARKRAAELALKFRGTVGLIVLAKRLEAIPSAREALQALTRAGLRIHMRVLNRALDLAGE